MCPHLSVVLFGQASLFVMPGSQTTALYHSCSGVGPIDSQHCSLVVCSLLSKRTAESHNNTLYLVGPFYS